MYLIEKKIWRVHFLVVRCLNCCSECRKPDRFRLGRKKDTCFEVANNGRQIRGSGEVYEKHFVLLFSTRVACMRAVVQ